MFTLPFVLQLVSPIVISTIVDRLGTFGKDTDWTKLKIEADAKVRSVVPGQLLDDTCVRFVNRQIDNVQVALKDSGEEAKVLKLLADGQWVAAGEEIVKHAFPDLKAAAA